MFYPKPPDRVPITCPQCKGAGIYRQYVMEPIPEPIIGPAEIDMAASSPGPIVTEKPCERCDGEGMVLPADGETVDLVRNGKVIGQCEVPARIIPHPLVDMRPGDYTPKVLDGRMVYEVARNLGPGDLACLVGYRKVEA